MNNNPSELTPHKLLEYYVKANGMRNSIERKIVLDTIIEYDGHFTTKQIYALIKKNHPIALASVYNCIETFLKASIVVKHPFPCREAWYELKERATKHHHYICTECGKVKEFSDIKISQKLDSRSFSSFTPLFHSLYIYGLCRKCSQKNITKDTETTTRSK